MLTSFHSPATTDGNAIPCREIDTANVRLYFLSRNLNVMALLIGAALVLAVMIAWMLRSTDRPASPPPSAVQIVKSQLAENHPRPAEIARAIVAISGVPPEGLEEAITASAMPPNAKNFPSAVVASLRDPLREPTAFLLIIAHQVNPPAGANEVVGSLYAAMGRNGRAREYYKRELERHPGEQIRAKMISFFAGHGDFAALAQFANDPAFAPHISTVLRLKLALHQRDWPTVAAKLVEMEFAAISAQPLILALAAGFAWLVIALHSGQPNGLLSYRIIVPLLAVCVGASGALAAHIVDAWQEEILGLRESGQFLSDFAFYAGIVSPREEILKLFLLAPFLPALTRRRDPLETLIVSGCIGLGFAIEGNLQLCRTVKIDEAFGRLLTANFFHFAATALTGTALCNCLHSKCRKPLPFLLTLAGVILAHAVYDTFSMIAQVRSFSWVSIASDLVISKLFFIELRRWRNPMTDQFFLGATLSICLAGLAATALIMTSIHSGFNAAIWALLKNAACLLLIGFVFFFRFANDLAPTQQPTVSEP